MPNRIIKESVCTSETIDRMSWFEECFYTRLWTACDDYGRMDARPAILKSKLFPLKDRLSLKDVESALHRLADIGCVMLYECDGKPYLYLPAWEVHQIIRAKKSKYPAPDDGACIDTKSSENICKQMKADESKCSRNPIQSESESNPNPNPTRTRDPAIAAVMSAYLGKINPTPSQSSLDELKGYVEEMGAECCLRAFDIALDSKKTTWPYIRAILRTKLSQGVCCLADWDEADKKHEQAQRVKKGKNLTSENIQPSAERIQRSADWLDSFLAKQKEKEESKK